MFTGSLFKWAHESLRVVNPTLWMQITYHNKFKIKILLKWVPTVEIQTVKLNQSVKKRELEDCLLFVMLMVMVTLIGKGSI